MPHNHAGIGLAAFTHKAATGNGNQRATITQQCGFHIADMRDAIFLERFGGKIGKDGLAAIDVIDRSADNIEFHFERFAHLGIVLVGHQPIKLVE